MELTFRRNPVSAHNSEVIRNKQPLLPCTLRQLSESGKRFSLSSSTFFTVII
ncbi:MAG: hypothetical protein GX025_01410 [Clostridiales bacterium]|nr:hypothetical protein [Clostridiales bacterium]